MTDSEYRRYIRELMFGIEMLRGYGNWAVSPWLIKKYGKDRVEADIQDKVGKKFHIREAVYKNDGATKSVTKYYILEEDDGRQKKGRGSVTGGKE